MGKMLVPNHDPERLSRVMDERYRLIGVDVNALDEQVAAKKALKDQKAELEAQEARQAQACDALLMKLQVDAEKRRRELAKADGDFRATQKPDTRREWDLNDPKALWSDRPAREGDDDPRCGPASLQKFDGEDLSQAMRVAEQQAQLREWLESQRTEKLSATQAADQDADVWAQRTAAQVAVMAAAERRAAEEKARQAQTTRDENQRLADERRAREEAERRFAAAADEAEIERMLEDPWLNEKDRIGVGTFKGMDEHERAVIREMQRLQAEAKAARAKEAREAEMEEARRMVMLRKELARQELAKAELLREQAEQAAEFLQTQRDAKRQTDATLRDMFKNEIRPEFFEQFGKSHR
ncbi:unnamed protein product [Pedinophyceae sp. YPF-701]|nr:unnamed protein product [Pedinophyceae sp. YPF-701]